MNVPQRFAFQFYCPTEGMAHGLIDFLQRPHDAGYESTTDRAAVCREDHWHVVGTTHPAVWSLSSLEHLFMRMRGAGPRYESELVSLELVTAS